MDKLLQKQLKEFDEERFGWYYKDTASGFCHLYNSKIKQFLTDFYYKIKEDQQKNKIIAIEKKMLKDKDFPIDKLLEKEREKILQIVIEDVPHKYQVRLLKELKK